MCKPDSSKRRVLDLKRLSDDIFERLPLWVQKIYAMLEEAKKENPLPL
ncbi:MAG: hypothetical protein L6N96_04755 [Candidatus Methylarchaceae archaeon HK02M2]|nr:hypothetical protein [Candidatus Methylarchaceae archaeon HK02M2]